MFTRNLTTATCLVAVLGSIAWLPRAAEAEPVKLKIPKYVVATAFNAVFASTKVHVDSFGPKKGTSWLEENSYVLLPNGKKVAFELGEYKYKINKFRYLKHYVNDMTTHEIQASVAGDRIEVDAYFESQGEELKGKCIRRLAGKWGECTLEMERDVELDDTILSMSFVPVAYEGSISYADPEITFKTDVHINSKLCQAFSGICGSIEGKIRKELTESIEDTAKKALKRAEVRAHVGKALRKVPILRDLIQNWKVLAVESKGQAFVVTVAQT
jgi:hypothetical protein